MDTAEKQRAHYAAVRQRLQNPPNAFGFDPEAPYMKANRRLHPVIDDGFANVPVEEAKHEINRRIHKVRQKARNHKIRQQTRHTQEAARKRREEIERPYEEWERIDADKASRDSRADQPSGNNGGGASVNNGFSPKASAQGFREWLAKRNREAIAERIAAAGDKTAAQGNAKDAGEAESVETPLPSLDYNPQRDASGDASDEIK